MNDVLLRAQIRMVHRRIHALRKLPMHPRQAELLAMHETSLADLTFARTELKRIDARRSSRVHTWEEESKT